MKVPDMGAPISAPPHLCRLLFPVGVFLLLLYLTSPRLPGLPRSVCIWGPRPCPWDGEMPLDKDNKETLPPAAGTPSSAPSPSPPGPQGQGSEQFQIQRLQRAFAASLAPNGQIVIGEYLQGWTELIKLLDALGTAFRLVSAEAAGKVGTLQELRGGRHGRHYATLQAMVAFEAGPGAGAGAGPGGLRTLLRLHRALRWLQLFLRGLAEDGDAAPARLCAEAYRQALAPFHAWWVRRAAALAFLALPARAELLRLVCAGAGAGAGAGPCAQGTLRATVRTLERVWTATQDVYAAQGLLGLP